MRGEDRRPQGCFSYVRLEERIAADHPLRARRTRATVKLDDYEREHYRRYADFAETVKLILQKAIEASNIPRLQSIQHRAKSPKSLQDRLEESGKLDSDDIENERRDRRFLRRKRHSSSAQILSLLEDKPTCP
jgi:hypothetical protein